MSVELGDARQRVLTALSDTFVASVAPPHGADRDGFFARPASALGVPGIVASVLTDRLPPEQAAGLVAVLDALGGVGFADAPLAAREAMVAHLGAASAQAGLGITTLAALIIRLAYALPDETGRNPFWGAIGYPGPSAAPATARRELDPVVPVGDAELRADVVVVGSGAGGSVVASELAAAGHSVVVLEAGDYCDGEDFVPLELVANDRLYYRGNAAYTADLTVNLLAGRGLGGGTTINWSNCVRPTDRLRAAWATEHGLSGVDTPEFDAHLDAVLARIGANDQASVYNGPHQRMVDGAERLGWAVRRAHLNLDPARLDLAQAGFAAYGDRTGAKQSTVRTFLADAAAHGAQLLVRTQARRILVEAGRAAGVEALVTAPDGTTGSVTVRAHTVVVACGALETPALLLRSGIGGPAVGRHLHLHPAGAASGVYPDRQDPWWGPIQSAIVTEFMDLEPLGGDPGAGFLIESVAFHIGQFAALTPWENAAAHKQRVARVAHAVALVAIQRDQGAGTVTVDRTGEAVHRYPFDDPRDRRTFYRGITELARLHEAAGAEEIYMIASGAPIWRRGEDLDAALRAWTALPIGPGGHYAGTAHQMGSARMGTDPATSVAAPTGELHDAAGVWIGDTSAFPTALGVNPMVTCMALARRTAGFIRDSASTATAATAATPAAAAPAATAEAVG